MHLEKSSESHAASKFFCFCFKSQQTGICQVLAQHYICSQHVTHNLVPDSLWYWYYSYQVVLYQSPNLLDDNLSVSDRFVIALSIVENPQKTIQFLPNSGGGVTQLVRVPS